MAEVTTEEQTIEKQVVAALRTLPPERMQEVLDFAVFLRTRIAPTGDERWDAIFATEQPAIDDWANGLLASDEHTTSITTNGNELRPSP